MLLGNIAHTRNNWACWAGKADRTFWHTRCDSRQTPVNHTVAGDWDAISRHGIENGAVVVLAKACVGQVFIS